MILMTHPIYNLFIERGELARKAANRSMTVEVSQVERRALFIMTDSLGPDGMCELLPPLIEAVIEQISNSSEAGRRLQAEWLRAKEKAREEMEDGQLEGHYGEESIRPDEE